MYSTLETKNCPICGKDEYTDFRFGLIQCTNCGVVLDLKIFKPDSNLALNEHYFGDSCLDHSFWVSIFERWNNFWTGRRILKLSLPGNKTLEIGPGRGSFALWLRDHGFDVKIFDLSQAICDRLSKIGFQTCSGSISNLHSEAFDLIIMKHVLEHMNRPLDFIKELKSFLKYNGTVYVAVPNVGSWEARLPGWNCYEPYHLSYFQPSVLRWIFEKAGLKVESIETRESFSGWYLAVVRTLLGFGRKSRIAADIGDGLANRSPLVEAVYRLAMITVGLFSYPLRKIQGSLCYGDEVVVIARRSD